MSVDVLGWNVADALTNPKRMPGVVSKVISHEPDVGIFSEAYDDTSPNTDTLLEAIDRFEEKGYSVFHGPYNDSDGRPDSHGILAIYRVAAKASLVSFALRNAIKLELNSDDTEGVQTNLWGFHGDDRDELRREIQYQALGVYLGEPMNPEEYQELRYLDDTMDWDIYQALEKFYNTIDLDQINSDGADGLIGDGNEMHHSDKRAKLLRVAYPLLNAIPNVEPASHDRKISKIKLGISLGQRVTRMADGGAVGYLEKTLRFKDADPKHLPTMPTRYPIVQIDRIMTRGAIATKNHQVHAAHSDSDHRAVSSLVYGIGEEFKQ